MTAELYPFLAQLDAFLGTPQPSKEDLRTLKAALENPHLDQYFFSRLTHEDWLAPLDEHGFFHDLAAYSSRLIYLGKIAAQHPWPVALLLRQASISEHNKHQALEVARNLPHDVLWSLVPTLQAWIAQEHDSLAAFSWLHLTQDLLIQGAPTPLKATFTASFLEPWLESVAHEESAFGQIETHLDFYHYAHFLEEHRTLLHQERWYGDVLCVSLAKFATLRQLLDGSEADHYRVYRPHLDHRERFDLGRPDNALIDALVALMVDPAFRPWWQQLWTALSWQPYSIFKRLRLYWLGQVDDVPRTWVQQALLDRQAFDEPTYEMEYTAACERQLKRLPGRQQTQVLTQLLAWLEQGTVTYGWRRLDPALHEENTEALARRQWRQLHKLGPNLPPPVLERRAQLDKQFGEVPEPSISTIQVVEGSHSTLAPDAFQGLSAPELQRLLRRPAPPTGQAFDREEDRLEGVAHRLAQDVGLRPRFYYEHLPLWAELPAPYLGSILSGLLNRKEELAGVEWTPCLETLTVIEGRKDRGERSRLRGQLCTLIEIILLKDGATRQQGRTQVLPIVEALILLLSDHDPLSDVEDPGVERYGDAYSRSINVTRGQAIHALVAVMAWVIDEQEIEPDLRQAALERLRTALLEHYRMEQSSAVFAAPAPFLAYLHDREREWFTAFWRPLILDAPPHLGGAAWSTYLEHSQYSSALFREMRPAYVRYARQMATDSPGWPTGKDTQRAFGSHLMIFFVRGVLQFGEQDALLETFLERAPAETVGEALSSLGRTLEREEQVDEGPLSLARQLWQFVRDTLLQRRPADRQILLRPFGWWYASGKFDETWALHELQTIAAEALVEGQPQVIECLTQIAPTYPVEVLTILRYFVGQKNMYLHEVLNFRPILDMLLKQRSSELDQAVNSLVEAIMGLGVINEFRPYYRT
ncbi:hypothetical protein V3W47_08645 [Deinococcus sp. YIM 134068]|uniref:hypothetical protein n=1 Tax=Deinococcus lichenicola TaxID=3118910 RepID=UPI002F92E5CF